MTTYLSKRGKPMIYDVADPECDFEALWIDFSDFRPSAGRWDNNKFDENDIISWISWNIKISTVKQYWVDGIIEAWLALDFIRREIKIAGQDINLLNNIPVDSWRGYWFVANNRGVQWIKKNC